MNLYCKHVLCFIAGGILSCGLGLYAQKPDTLNLLRHWANDSLEGSALYNNTYNEVWGFSQNGEEFAVIGSTAGTHIIPLDSVHGPTDAIFIGSPSAGPQVIHRDYHDFNGYLYAVCDEGRDATLQIIDIRDIREGVKVVYDSNELFSRAHNIFIDTSRSTLYVCSHKADSYAPLGLYDISDPPNPRLIDTYHDFGDGGISHVHDAYVSSDTAFLNCGFNGLRVLDFSDPDRPELIASLKDYPFAGYNHSGWATEGLEYYYMADETHGFEMKTIKAKPFDEFEVINTFNAGNSSQFSIPHNQLIHCNFLFASYYFDGLQVYDISEPESPERKYVFPTSTIEPYDNYKGAWGVYPFLPSGRILVSDMQNGLFVLEGPECDFPSSVNLSVQRKMQVYPNPTRGVLHVDIPFELNDISIKFINMNGQILYRAKLNGDNINLPAFLPNGTYIAQLSSLGHTEYHRIQLVR